MRYPSIIVGLALSLSACASGGFSPTPGSGFSRDMITREEIAASDQTNAYDAIRDLRPRWIRQQSLTVYLDGALAAGGREAAGPEGVNFLRTLSASSIQELSFLDEQRASIRHGMGMGAVIQVITTRR